MRERSAALGAARYTPKVATRPVLRIFISSTAVDLLDYRAKVRDAVLRLGRCPAHRGMFLRKLMRGRVDPAQMKLFD